MRILTSWRFKFIFDILASIFYNEMCIVSIIPFLETSLGVDKCLDLLGSEAKDSASRHVSPLSDFHVVRHIQNLS